MYLILLLSFNILSKEIEHPIYNQIIKNKPSIDKSYAMKLSNLIHKYSRLYKIPADIYTAILMQESRYVLGAKNCKRGIRFKTPDELKTDMDKDESKFSTKRITPYVKSKVCSDLGIAQIRLETAESYNFDVNKLLTDLEYSVNAGAKVFKWFVKTYPTIEEAVKRYNVGTAKNAHNWTSAGKYWSRVRRYF